MPLDANELAELRAYVNSPEGANDHEAAEALAEESQPSRGGNAQLRGRQNAASNPTGFHSQATARGPSTNAQPNTGPSRKGLANPPQPSTQRAGIPSFTDGKTFGGLPGEQASAGVMGPGAAMGGLIGGTIGSIGGIGGRIAGAGIGGALGNYSEQHDTSVNSSDPVQYDMRGSEPVPFYRGGTNAAQGPQVADKPTNWNDVGAAGTAQAGMSLGMAGAGIGAAKLGFPRIGAALGGFTPQQGVMATAPNAARGTSSAALQAVDGATTGAGAVQRAATGAQQALQNAPIANAADQARPMIGPLRDQLSSAVSQQVPLDTSVAQLGADLPAAQAAQSARSAFPNLRAALVDRGTDAAVSGTMADQLASDLPVARAAQGSADAMPGFQSRLASQGSAAATGGMKTAQLASDLPIAQNAARGAAAVKTIQPQLAQGATDIAPLNAELAKQVRAAFGTMSPDEIAAGLKSGKISYQEAQLLMQQSSGADLTQAFRHPQRFPQTAGSSEVANARVPVAATASRQSMLSNSLGQANDAQSAALSRGLGSPESIASDFASSSGQQAVNRANAAGGAASVRGARKAIDTATMRGVGDTGDILDNLATAAGSNAADRAEVAGGSAAVRAARKAMANADLRGITGTPDDILARLSQRSGQAAAGQSDVAAITDSLGQANKAVSAASARGLAPGSGGQLADDAQGLAAISKLGVKVPGVGKVGRLLGLLGDDAPGVAPVNLGGGRRAQQTVSALLADRGLSSARPLSNSSAYRVANVPNGLDALIAALSQNRSKK